MKAINKLKFKPAKGGPLEVLRRNRKRPRLEWHPNPHVGIGSPVVLAEYVPVNDWPHELKLAIDLVEAGHISRAGIRKFKLRKTGRWVIDDLYGAVMVKGRKG